MCLFCGASVALDVEAGCNEGTYWKQKSEDMCWCLYICKGVCNVAGVRLHSFVCVDNKLVHGDAKPCCGIFVAHQWHWMQRPRRVTTWTR